MNTIIKYRVDIGYRKFDFISGAEALSFAETAARTLAKREDVEIIVDFDMPAEETNEQDV
jgi:hypothetical protein